MKTPKITHIMDDGTLRNSIKGMVIPLTDNTLPAYMLIANAKKTKWKENVNEQNTNF